MDVRRRSRCNRDPKGAKQDAEHQPPLQTPSTGSGQAPGDVTPDSKAWTAGEHSDVIVTRRVVARMATMNLYAAPKMR
jgi:hypothetical protein